VASIYHRFAMVALAVVDRQGWRVSELELDVRGPSFTTDTLQRFHALGYAPAELVFIVGADAFAEIESWKDYPAIVDRAHFAVIARAPFDVNALAGRLPALASRMVRPEQMAAATLPVIALIDARTAAVSSTAVRARRAAGQSIAGMVPALVATHIERHGLYAGSGADWPAANAGAAADGRHG
jgi:nicotinate-nucleotide adenylyltransferase